MKFHHWVFVGMGVGLVAGLALHGAADPESALFRGAVWAFDVVGKDIFIGALKMIISPLVFASLVAGVSRLPSMRELGAIGWKTFAYYLATTSLAVGIGLTAVLLIRPGHRDASAAVRAHRESQLAAYREAFREAIGGEDPTSAEHLAAYRRYVAEEDGATLGRTGLGSTYDQMRSVEGRGAAEMLRRDVLRPILSNPVEAMAGTQTLGIICFAILTGLACLAVGERARPVAQFFQAMNRVMMTITLWVMRIAPVAVACIVASLVATVGLDALASLGWYSATVVLGIAVHVVLLLGIVWAFGRVAPRRFVRGIQDAWLVAFTTTSSAATLPVTLKCVTEDLGASPKVANFVLPIGATVNMDGTALYEGVAIIFLIQVFGGLDDVPIAMTAARTLVIFLTAVLASVGAAAVPSAGLVTMAIVANAVGLPLHYIFFIFPVDRLLDMFRTSTNVLGDAVGAVVVNRLEGARLGDSDADAAA